MIPLLFFNIVLEILINKEKQERCTDWEGRNTILYMNDIMVYVENPNESTETFGTNKQVLQGCRI